MTIWDLAKQVSVRHALAICCTFTLLTSFFTPVLRGTVEKTFGGQLQFLTIIALLLTTTTLLMNYFTNWKNITYDLLVLSTVLETIVTVFYWTLYHWKRALLYPPNMDNIPFLVDITLHFLPAVALWLELLTTVKLHKMSWKHIYMIVIFSVAYMLWAEYCYLQNGYYVYPILSMLDYKGKVILAFASMGIAVLIYVMSVQVHTISLMIRLALKKACGRKHRIKTQRILARESKEK